MVEFDIVKIGGSKRGYPRFSVEGQWELIFAIYPIVFTNRPRVYINGQEMTPSAIGQLENLIEAVKNEVALKSIQ